MTDVICLQCWAILHQLRPAHQDHELYHPAPDHLGRKPQTNHPVHLPAEPTYFDSDSTNQPAITYPEPDPA